ncbi:MAG TPA: helix-turn-helix transcriptional regulator [Ktedonobacteraceae bacterium]|nr:helix-turn-helix transcriptional regulator [Ktedonobacteraceae bacterium]
MPEGIGEYIRQARRQRNLTQTELGGERFSKSYVSAVERDKIAPSPDALKFFAQQLEQSEDYFTTLFLQSESSAPLSTMHELGLTGVGSRAMQDDELILLDTLLDNTELRAFPTHYEQLPMLSPDAIALLPPARQARYYFLLGLIAQQNNNLSTALYAFERALMLAPARHYPAILDELGSNYYLAEAYQTALNYYMRALYSLQNGSMNGTLASMRFKIELHCGNAFRALGAYREACEYYEHARTYMNSQHDMKSAGILYWGLGYCSYELLQQKIKRVDFSTSRFAPEEIERQYQRSISFLMQSRSVYQVSGDRNGEATVRLTLALVLLDFSNWRRARSVEKKDQAGKQPISHLTSLLQDAEEQCRQVLMNWEELSGGADSGSFELDPNVFVAIAYRIRVNVERAAIARLDGYKDTANRDRVIASYLCQEILASFSYESTPGPHLQNALTLDAQNFAQSAPSLPHFPAARSDSAKVSRKPISQAELFFAAGTLAEEFGRTATTKHYASDCYARADQFYQAALDAARSVITSREGDPGYLIRMYQRCVAILEDRIEVAPNLYEETTHVLLSLLKKALYELQFPPKPSARGVEMNNI